MYVGISIISAGTAAFLVFEYCWSAKGSGIPDVKAAVSGYDLPVNFSGSCLITKTLGLSLAVGAGLSLGKEGPLIHIGVCWAYILQRLVTRVGATTIDVMPLHDFACAGAAAGVSTAFGAPLGGVLFAAEELGSARVLGTRTLLYSFMASTSASMSLKYLNLSGANKLTLFLTSSSSFSAKKEWHAWEMAAFLFVGVTCGLVGVLFVRVNVRWTTMRRQCAKVGRLWMIPQKVQDCVLLFLPWLRNASSEMPPFQFTPVSLNVFEGMVIACVTAMVNYPIMEIMRALSVEAIHALFEACPANRAKRFGLCDPEADAKPNVEWSSCCLLLLAAGLRVVMTSYTFGAALPSGLFIPSLFIGACIGRVVGNFVYFFVESGILSDIDMFDVHVEPGTFAMVGAIAMLSGFCRMTVSLVVIMFELTAEISWCVPFMCAALAAKLVADPMSPSIYDAHAKLNGIAPIEELPDLRLEMLVADLAVPISEDNILDASEPVLMRTLRELANSDEDEDIPILVVCPHVEGRDKGSVDDVIGVIDRSHLSSWLDRLASDADLPCQLMRGRRISVVCPEENAPSMPRGSFRGTDRAILQPSLHSPPGGRDAPLLQSQPLAGRQSAAMRQSYLFDTTTFDEEDDLPDTETSSSVAGIPEDATSFWIDPDGGARRALPEVDLQPSDGDDASNLVDKRVVKMTPYAPLLTAHCIFREKPKLHYIVCYDRDWPNNFAVLSRSDFEASLRTPCFPLAHPQMARPSVRGRTTGEQPNAATEMAAMS